MTDDPILDQPWLWQEHVVGDLERGLWCGHCALPAAAIATHVWVHPETLELLGRRRVIWCLRCRTQLTRATPTYLVASHPPEAE